MATQTPLTVSWAISQAHLRQIRRHLSVDKYEVTYIKAGDYFVITNAMGYPTQFKWIIKCSPNLLENRDSWCLRRESQTYTASSLQELLNHIKTLELLNVI